MDREATAIHEAGHAVIGRVLDLACGGATIVPNEAENEAGHTFTADPHASAWQWEERYMAAAFHGEALPIYRDLRMAFRARIITFMSGAEAENELRGGCQGGDGYDRDQIELMAASHAELSDDLWERYEPRMRRQARRLIRKHRGKIERVAKALIEQNTLSADQIDSLIR